jgi:hypothetical protein
MAVSTLTELAAVSAEAGDTAKALRLVTDVTAALNSIDKTPGRWNPRWDLVLLSRAATTLARVGHTDRAVTMAAEILAQTSLMRPEERPKRRAPGSPLDDFFDRQDTELESRRQFSCVTAMVGAAEAFAGSGRRADGLKTVRDAVVVAEAIVGAVQKANAFIDIGRSLANMEARQLAIDALTRADDVLRLYVDQRQRTPLEILLAPAFLRCERRQDAVRVWTRAMSTAQLHGRRMVLSAIEAGAPIVAALEGPDTVWKLYELVVDVDRWWSADRRA